MSTTGLAFQKMKVARALSPLVINDNTAYTVTAFDTSGCHTVTCLIHFGAMDIAVAALKVQESDTLTNSTTLSSGADISGADFSVSPATLPSATADNTFVAVTIRVTGARKRYFNLSFTAGDGAAGTYATAFWLAESLDESLNTAAGRGLGQHLIV